MGITIFSGYLFLSIQLTTVPAGAGNPAALSVTFHPSTKSLVSSANLRNFRVGTNSCNIFINSSSWLNWDCVDIKKSFVFNNLVWFYVILKIIIVKLPCYFMIGLLH
jgi:hypothetical protein